MAGRRREKRTPVSKLDATPPWPGREREEPPATTGPYDVRDAPVDGILRVDVGALRVPATPGFELRLDLAENQQVTSASLSSPSGSMQLGVFAAPRTQGIWDDVRAEIADSVKSTGGNLKVREDGPFGPELIGTLKMDGRATPVRFIGVDGPRWFLRAMIVGAVANDAARSRVLEKALREVVVVRGDDPLPVREQVPLHLPIETIGGGDGDEDAGGDDEFGEEVGEPA